MKAEEKSLAARIWKIQVIIDSLIFLFEHFETKDYGDIDEPLTGLACVLKDIQNEMDAIRARLDSLNV